MYKHHIYQSCTLFRYEKNEEKNEEIKSFPLSGSNLRQIYAFNLIKTVKS